MRIKKLMILLLIGSISCSTTAREAQQEFKSFSEDITMAWARYYNKEPNKSKKILSSISGANSVDTKIMIALKMTILHDEGKFSEVIIISDGVKGGLYDLVKKTETGDYFGWNNEDANFFYSIFLSRSLLSYFKLGHYENSLELTKEYLSLYGQTLENKFLYYEVLGISCHQLEDYICSKKYHLKLLDSISKNSDMSPYEDGVFFNLACIESILGDASQSYNWLKKTSWSKTRLKNKIDGDEDLENFRQSTFYQKIISN